MLSQLTDLYRMDWETYEEALERVPEDRRVACAEEVSRQMTASMLPSGCPSTKAHRRDMFVQAVRVLIDGKTTETIRILRTQTRNVLGAAAMRAIMPPDVLIRIAGSLVGGASWSAQIATIKQHGYNLPWRLACVSRGVRGEEEALWRIYNLCVARHREMIAAFGHALAHHIRALGMLGWWRRAIDCGLPSCFVSIMARGPQ